jgi:hypothetical protein
VIFGRGSTAVMHADDEYVGLDDYQTAIKVMALKSMALKSMALKSHGADGLRLVRNRGRLSAALKIIVCLIMAA